MSMYNACKFCGEPTAEPGLVACSNPEHRRLAKIGAQISFDSRPTKESAILLAREAGLPENYFLQQIAIGI